MRRLVVVSLLALLSACRGSADYSDKQTIPVIDLARASPDAMTAQRASYSSSDPGFSNFESVAYSGGRIHRGDTIEVTIFDTGEKGLFSATSSKALDLGRFTVDDGGSVNMPFVGRQYVLGLTPEAVQSRIVASLKDKAVSPQAVVKIVDSPDSTVTVAGGVHEPGRQPLRGGERVLDVIARSGGAASQPSTTTVTLIRGQQRADVPLARIVSDPQQNIYVQPDDEVIVGGRDASFTAFSGFKSVGEFRFAPGELTLAQALGRTGGLLDDRKDPRTFYLIRNQAQSASSAGSPAVIYRVNLKDASNFALMQQFQMRNGDILTTDASPVMSASSTAAPQPSASLMPSMSSLSSTSSIQGVSSLSSTSSVPGAPSMGSPSSVPGLSSVSSLSSAPGTSPVSGMRTAPSVGTTAGGASTSALPTAAAAAGSALPAALHAMSPPSAPGTTVAPTPQPAIAQPAVASVMQPEMVPIAGGPFRMGSGEDASEQPIHTVTVKPFQMAKYPVTVEQWNACVAAKACAQVADGADDAPISNVSWGDAEQFVAWLSQTSGRHYRLPSEAEWEYAARGGSESRYWWGDTMRAGLADCKGCGGPREGLQPDRVGSLPPNPFGLNDIGGGIAEWVEDCWHKDYHGAPADGSAWLASDCRQRVLRGGSWSNDPSYVRSASRASYDATVRYPTHGLRLALSP